MVDPTDRDARRWAAIEEAAELLVEGEHLRALEHLKTVIEADPENGYAYHYLGTALRDLERLEPARDAFRAALRVAPDYLAARVALAHVLCALGKPREALLEAEQAVRRFPEDGDAHFAAGRALAALGDRDGAIACLERFLGSHPEVEASIEARGLIAMLQDSSGPVDLE